jgi:phosphoglycolate phosphatase
VNDSCRTLFLFDIDGTLVQTLGAGVRSMSHAFRRLHLRTDPLHGVPVAGRTDLAIVTDVFRSIDVEPRREVIDALLAAYLDDLPNELSRASGNGFGVLPGVRAVLDGLDRERSIAVGLLTGNFEAAARLKLGHFDLWRRFSFGAFGDAHTDRRDLLPVAIERASAAGVDVPMSRVVIIGDTPLDVDCARAHGAVAVGVATGHYTRDDLVRAGADLVLGTLEEWSGGEWKSAIS